MNDTAELTFRDVATAAPAPAAENTSAITAGIASVQGEVAKFDQIADRLGFVVTAKLLEGLGFTAHAVKASRLYRQSEFPAICDELIKHIKAARDA